MGAAVARLVGVGVRYGATTVLAQLDLDVERGHQLAVLGPSGAGKSTLVRLLDGQLPPSSGRLELSTGDLRRGAVFQDALLYPWLTVADNVALAQRFTANAARADRARVAELLDLLGLVGVASRYPDEISGGQAQRASLARALAIDPDLLLLDEPFSALDPVTRWELQRWLRAESTRRGITSVVVTHDIEEALVLADRVVLLGVGGRLVGRWDNEPASDHDAARVHPLREVIRQAFDDAAFGAAARTPVGAHG